METMGTSGLSAAQKEKFASTLAEIQDCCFAGPIDDLDAQYTFAPSVRDMVVRPQAEGVVPQVLTGLDVVLVLVGPVERDLSSPSLGMA